MCSLVACPRAKHVSSQIIPFSLLSCSIFTLFYCLYRLSQALQSCAFLTGNLLECEGDVAQQARLRARCWLTLVMFLRPGSEE